MGKIEEALKEYGLSRDFNQAELEKTYKIKKTVIPIDFRKGVVKIDKYNSIDYNYQILLIYNKLKTLTMQTNFLKDGTFNIPEFNIFPKIDNFYKKELNRIYLSQLFSSLKLDFTNLDISIDNAISKEDLETAFNDFYEVVKEDCTLFTSRLLEDKLGNKNARFATSIILQGDISIRNVVVRTFNFATGIEELVTTKFKKEVEKYPHNTDEYRRGLTYYTQMLTSSTYNDAVEIYNKTKEELLPEEEKSNIRK